MTTYADKDTHSDPLDWHKLIGPDYDPMANPNDWNGLYPISQEDPEYMPFDISIDQNCWSE